MLNNDESKGEHTVYLTLIKEMALQLNLHQVTPENNWVTDDI